MRLRLCRLVAFGFISTHAQGQAALVEYAPRDGKTVAHQYFGYDIATGAGFKIASDGRIFLYTPDGIGYKGTAGASQLTISADVDRYSIMQQCSAAFPQLHIVDIESDPNANQLQITSDYGGSVYEAVAPLGNRILPISFYPKGVTIPNYTAKFYFDTRHRLRQRDVIDSSTTEYYDYDDTNTAQLHPVESYLNGYWVLESDSTRFIDRADGIFQPDYIVEYARSNAFSHATSKFAEEEVLASKPSGQHELERRRKNVLDTRVSQSTKRFALILTGLIIIAVGSLAWWKNRS